MRTIVSALSSTISSRTRTPIRRSSAAIMRPAHACASKRMNGSASSSDRIAFRVVGWRQQPEAILVQRGPRQFRRMRAHGARRDRRIEFAGRDAVREFGRHPGRRARAAADARAARATRAAGRTARSIAPIRRRPTSFFSSLSASGIRSTSASTCSACASRMLPASVSTGCRRERSNNCTLYSLSSVLICRLTADCVRPMASPARANVRCRAMATSVLNARNDMGGRRWAEAAVRSESGWRFAARCETVPGPPPGFATSCPRVPNRATGVHGVRCESSMSRR